MELPVLLNKISPLPAEAAGLLTPYVREISFPKGHLLMRSGRVEPAVYFIRKGMVRAYALYGENEISFWFGAEGSAVLSMKSYVSGEPGYEDIELIEAADFFAIDAGRLQQLYRENIDLANWGRKFAEAELIRTEERLIGRQFGTAIDRYKKLLEDSPDLLRRVPLGYIASYLGISQVSLSRIRAEIGR